MLAADLFLGARQQVFFFFFFHASRRIVDHNAVLRGRSCQWVTGLKLDVLEFYQAYAVKRIANTAT